MNRESNPYTIVYASVMVIIVAVALAFTSQALKSKQKDNIRIDKMQQVLRSVHLTPKATEATAKYSEVIRQELLVDASGQVVETFEGTTIANNEAFAMNTANAFFEARQGNREQVLPVYIATVDGQTKYIFPIEGRGLWNRIWGYIALNDDLKTVYGADFSHAGETPGLGAEIATKHFSEQFVGKSFFRNGAYTGIAVVKAGKSDNERDYVDGISGGTLTSNGVDEMLGECMAFFVPYMERVATNSTVSENEQQIQ